MKKVLVILLVVFILIQFFPIDRTNPTPTPQLDFLTIKKTPESTATIIKNSCYDCHSNETKYPWYSRIQPVSWLLKNHIDEGRKKLNFSNFANYEPKRQAHKMDEAAEMIEKGEMPMDSYVLIHSAAKLSEQQKQELIKYFKFIGSDTRMLNDLPEETQKK